tara:strand:+ start:1533 stop:2225 length:693 start_codon:yes stop_codon:yes gene_type:complete
MNSFVLSYYISLIIQLLAFVVQFYGFFLQVTPNLIPLKYALNIEVWVSVVEFLVYLWIGTNLANYDVVMTKRYADWFVTTNGLMISISLLFIFFNQREQSEPLKEEDNNVETLVENNINKYIPLILYNNAMLLCGFMGEKKIIPKAFSFSFGFLFFFLSFYHLFHFFASKSRSGTRFFYIITTIWALYGFSHLLPTLPKNVCYNILDLISKNLFGVFMVYLILHPDAFVV